MRINVHAGHTPSGRPGCGAIGIGDESSMNRDVAGYLIQFLREAGHTVYDCTDNDGANERENLFNIVKKCNTNSVDIDISIHHNASVKKDYDGDGITMGVGAYIYSLESKSNEVARRIIQEVSSELDIGVWGLHVNPNLYVLHHTVAPAVLVECCFVDDKDDMNAWDPAKIARGIMRAVTGDEAAEIDTRTAKTGGWYKVQTGAFKNKDYAEALKNTLKGLGYEDTFVQYFE